jgi:beta-galactosidase
MFTLDRRLRPANPNEGIVNSAGGPPIQIDVLVENEGRINYSHQLLTDRKGIVQVRPPTDPAPATHWSIYPLPMSDVSALRFSKADCSGPCFYRGTFNVDKPADTFLDTTHLTKGQMWVNGHALGRFWNVGPQKTLYVPGPWLKKGANEVVVFDVDGKPGGRLEGRTKADLGTPGASTAP